MSFKKVETIRSKLCGISKGVFSGYAPIIFSGSHCSFTEITTHSIILEYRFRNLPLDADPPSSNEPVVAIIPLVNKIRKNKSKTIAKNVAQYLFGNNEGKIEDKINIDKVDEIYISYIVLLHKLLTNKISTIL